IRYTALGSEITTEKRSGTRRLYVPDPLGPAVALLDNTQAITDSFIYFPCGEEVTHIGSTPTPLRFLGILGYHRAAVGRIYARARVLDTAKGRWLTQDPVWLYGGDWNMYRYLQNSPTTGIDPTGTKKPD